MAYPKFWRGTVGKTDDFGNIIEDVFIDGRTWFKSWACMSPYSWQQHGCGKFGLGHAAKYQKQPDGNWLKIEG